MHVNYQQAIDKNLLLDFKICYHGLLSMVSIALVDARKTSLTGVCETHQKVPAGQRKVQTLATPWRRATLEQPEAEWGAIFMAHISTSWTI